MKAVITVIGKDCPGIIWKVSGILFKEGINIEDISQTIMQEYFTMIMLVTGPENLNIRQLNDEFSELREEGLSIQLQKTEIFDTMHKV